MEEKKLALRFRFETLRLCISVMSNSLSHGTAYIIVRDNNVGFRKRDG